MTEPNLYDSYSTFMRWGETTVVDRPEDFEQLLADAGLGGRTLSILDFGFGAGGFMDWARGAGHSVTGVEILPEMIAAAAARGHRTVPAAESDRLGDGAFDAIVALDVLEHLDRAGFVALMALARRTLTPTGVLVARFPNADSPVFGRYHYGDLTHGRPLSADAVRQLCHTEAMRVVKAFNPRSIPPGIGRALKRRATYLVRDLIEILLGYVYFGIRFPMDPNVAVTLMRAEEAR